MKAVVFDIFGDYGHFGKQYTTSSPLTFSFPPPPTVKGIIGAILGIDKTSYHNELEQAGLKLGVSIQSPIRHSRITINHINTKGGHWTIEHGRIQIRTEFLCFPRYRLYITFSDEGVYENLKKMLMSHQTVFTLSLGLSELLASFTWIKEENLTTVENCKGHLDTVFPVDAIEKKSLQFTPGNRYQSEHVPVYMNSERIVSSYQDVIMETSGKPFQAVIKKGYQVENGNFIYLF
jgi:CRISPR-associated protein Cas5h